MSVCEATMLSAACRLALVARLARTPSGRARCCASSARRSVSSASAKGIVLIQAIRLPPGVRSSRERGRDATSRW